MKLNNKTIFLIILLVAAILRFFNYFEVPFTHDEFSALFRLQVESFRELIDTGVKPDGHPAGIQVFLYYWTMLFGKSAWVVKLPFTLFGLVSVYLIFRIGRDWFNETTGLLSAAFLASIQYTVMYSQIARPYISGLFFSLLMVYYLSRLVQTPDKHMYRNLLLFILAASLCAYNHHFSLLFAAIVGISGLFLIPRKIRIHYVLSGLVILLLYLPHLNIFLHQLKSGGVEGWLAKPGNDFLLQYIYYSFNYSWIVAGITLAVVLYGLMQVRQHSIRYKYSLVSLLWFMLPFLIGFFYSRYVNAVLQFSVLIFSFPFLLLFLFGFIKKQSKTINLMLVVVILTANTTSLVFGRKHYDIFYNSIYKRVLTDYDEIKPEKRNTTLFMIDSDREITDYYLNTLDIDTNISLFNERFETITDLKIYLEKNHRDYDQLYFGCLSSLRANIIPLIQDYYPCKTIQNNYFKGQTYLFTKACNRADTVIASLNFSSPLPAGWQSIDKSLIIPAKENPDEFVYSLPAKKAWGPSFSVPVEQVVKNSNNFLDVSVDARSMEKMTGIKLVAELKAEGSEKALYWGATDFSDFDIPCDSCNSWQRIHHSVKLSDARLDDDSIRLKVYVWNKSRKPFEMDDFTIRLREGNPRVYGLNEKL